MPNVYYDAEFAGIPLSIATISTTSGRDIAVLSPARGDLHANRDRGLKHRVASAELLFVDKPGKAPYLDRFDAVHALVLQGGAQVFSHPLLGSYRARIADFDIRADAGASRVDVSCTLYAEDEPQAVTPSGAGVAVDAGVEAVEVASGEADAALAELDRESETPASCAAAVAAWGEADDIDAQKVFLEAASLVEDLNAEIEALSQSLADWPAYRALCRLRYQVSRAAEAFTSAAEQLIDITVGRDAPLISICSEVYGAALAVERAAQVQKLNRIRTPGRVATGTALKMPATGAL